MMTTKKIRFVTDSTSDIPPQVVERYQMGVVPCFVNFGGKSYSDDGKELTRESFYEQMPSIRPMATTAAPPPGLAERIIDETFVGADHLIIITAPAKLSGIHNAMRLGSSKLPQDKVTLIDGGTVSMALGWQVITAAETAEATGGDVDAVLKAIQAVRDNQRLYAALTTLEYLKHSGRVGWAAAGIGALLQIKPIIEVRDGDVISVARVRTFSRALDEMLELVRKHGAIDRIAILHANSEDVAQQFRMQLGADCPDDVYIVSATPAIGTHTGPGIIGAAPVYKSWRS
jgi:DegV family protein with EDD domain